MTDYLRYLDVINVKKTWYTGISLTKIMIVSYTLPDGAFLDGAFYIYVAGHILCFYHPYNISRWLGIIFQGDERHYVLFVN